MKGIVSLDGCWLSFVLLTTHAAHLMTSSSLMCSTRTVSKTDSIQKTFRRAKWNNNEYEREAWVGSWQKEYVTIYTMIPRAKPQLNGAQLMGNNRTEINVIPSLKWTSSLRLWLLPFLLLLSRYRCSGWCVICSILGEYKLFTSFNWVCFRTIQKFPWDLKCFQKWSYTMQ